MTKLIPFFAPLLLINRHELEYAIYEWMQETVELAIQLFLIWCKSYLPYRHIFVLVIELKIGLVFVEIGIDLTFRRLMWDGRSFITIE